MKKNNLNNHFIQQENGYIKEDQELIKSVDECMSILKKRFKISPSSYRIKNVVDAMTDLIQYEKELIKSRKKHLNSI